MKIIKEHIKEGLQPLKSTILSYEEKHTTPAGNVYYTWDGRRDGWLFYQWYSNFRYNRAVLYKDPKDGVMEDFYEAKTLEEARSAVLSHWQEMKQDKEDEKSDNMDEGLKPLPNVIKRIRPGQIWKTLLHADDGDVYEDEVRVLDIDGDTILVLEYYKDYPDFNIDLKTIAEEGAPEEVDEDIILYDIIDGWKIRTIHGHPVEFSKLVKDINEGLKPLPFYPFEKLYRRDGVWQEWSFLSKNYHNGSYVEYVYDTSSDDVTLYIYDSTDHEVGETIVLKEQAKTPEQAEEIALRHYKRNFVNKTNEGLQLLPYVFPFRICKKQEDMYDEYGQTIEHYEFFPTEKDLPLDLERSTYSWYITKEDVIGHPDVDEDVGNVWFYYKNERGERIANKVLTMGEAKTIIYNHWKDYKKRLSHTNEGLQPLKYDPFKFYIGNRVTWKTPWGSETGTIIDIDDEYIYVEIKNQNRHEIHRIDPIKAKLKRI